jgi:signal transduction histidine kinase
MWLPEQLKNWLFLYQSVGTLPGLIFLLCLSSSPASGQPNRITELRQMINLLQQKDTFWVDQVNQLSWEFSNSEPDSSRVYAQQALEQAKILSYPKGMARAYNLLGVLALNNGRNQEGHQLNEQALPLAYASGDSFVISVVLNDLATTYDSRHQLDQSIHYYLLSLDYIPHYDTIGRVYTNGNIALLYLELGHKTIGKKYLEAALKTSNISGDPYVIEVYKSIESQYYALAGEHKKALSSIQEAYQIAYRYQHYAKALGYLCTEAQQFITMKRYERALNVLHQARELKEAYALPDAADQWIEKSMMHVLINTGRPEEVIQLGASQLVKIDSSNFSLMELADFHNLMSRAYAGTGDYKNAYRYQCEVELLRDSIYKHEISLTAAELEVQYQLEKKEAENEALRTLQQRDAERLKNQKQITVAMGAIIFLSIVIVLLITYAFWQKSGVSAILEKEVQRKTADLQARNEELERFAHIVSHDFKEPMRNIVSFVNLIERREDKLSSDTQTYFTYIQRSVRQLYSLVDDVLQFSRIDKTRLDHQAVDLQQVTDNICHNLQLLIQEKQAVLQYHGLPTINASQAHLFLILKNLIENGLVYNKSDHPMIRIAYQKNGELHQIIVQDNGLGIPPEYRDKVFKMFFRLHNRQEFAGTGMGLAIVKKLTDSIYGRISIQDGSADMSTSFCLEFP